MGMLDGNLVQIYSCNRSPSSTLPYRIYQFGIDLVSLGIVQSFRYEPIVPYLLVVAQSHSTTQPGRVGSVLDAYVAVSSLLDTHLGYALSTGIFVSLIQTALSSPAFSDGIPLRLCSCMHVGGIATC